MRIIVGIFLVGLLALTGCQKSQTAPVPAPPAATQPQKIGKPTIVASGKTPVDHVTEYFTAYKEKRFDAAYDLQPAAKKASQPKDQFIQTRQDFPITDFQITKSTQQGDTQIVEAQYNLGNYGTWVSAWSFKKQGKDWVASMYQVQQKQ